MKPTDTIKSGDPESRIPTWASGPWAIVGAVLLAVAFATTTPAARIAIAAFDDSEPGRSLIGGENADAAATASTETDLDVDPSPDDAARVAAPSFHEVWPGFIRLGGGDHWERTPITASSLEISRKLDRPSAFRMERRSGRTLASRVFVGLYRHLEAGLRHLTAPAFGSTAP